MAASRAPDFLKYVFLLQYLSIFSESILVGVSVYIQVSIQLSIFHAHSKALQSVKSSSQNHQQIKVYKHRALFFFSTGLQSNRDTCTSTEISNITATNAQHIFSPAISSCLSVPSEHVASQSKWQSADLDLVKLAKKRKSVWPALFRGNVHVHLV